MKTHIPFCNEHKLSISEQRKGILPLVAGAQSRPIKGRPGGCVAGAQSRPVKGRPGNWSPPSLGFGLRLMLKLMPGAFRGKCINKIRLASDVPLARRTHWTPRQFVRSTVFVRGTSVDNCRLGVSFGGRFVRSNGGDLALTDLSEGQQRKRELLDSVVSYDLL